MSATDDIGALLSPELRAAFINSMQAFGSLTGDDARAGASQPRGGTHMFFIVAGSNQSQKWVPAIPIIVKAVTVFNVTNAIVIGRAKLNSNQLTGMTDGSSVGGSAVIWWSNTALTAGLNTISNLSIHLDPGDPAIDGLWLSWSTANNGYVLLTYEHVQ